MAGHMKMTNGSGSTRGTFLVLVALLLGFPPDSHQDSGNESPVIDLHDGEEYILSGSNRFCYQNSIVPTWRQTWTRIQVKVWSSNVFKLVIVEGEEELQELERFSVWSWFQSLLRERHNETTINIGLFSKKTCFKIDPSAKAKYTVKPLRKFDIYLFLVFLSGALLLIFADSLSRSQVFFYSAGMSTGMIASLIILFFILARFLPKKSPFYLLIVGGWSFSVYAIQLVCRNLSIILREHWHMALGYVGVVGFISFAVCYRYGPLVDEKNINILSWTLQLFGLLLIYLGIQIQQVAFAIMVAALLSKNLEYPVFMAVTAWRKIRRLTGRWKPKPRRLLTEEEYQKEAEEETRRALDELRKICHSPEFSPWRAVSRLQSPKRFADFIEGSPHLMSNEVSVHAQEYGFGGSFFEDEFFDTDDDEEEEEEELKPLMVPE
ncbi:nuclear envelope integral membrane protein 1 [Paralichthys olivaceus]|uniref:nuclear envelope integral membrane protein 1 n=1 Tax=Paralichthys olivaceus TaxID=8255 RepID=UPI00097D999F|nr:PREDICTED: nuclear envelope integral membrane protein 1 [Paralichthys olivaceus]